VESDKWHLREHYIKDCDEKVVCDLYKIKEVEFKLGQGWLLP
jgi:hypothetical protein